MSKSFVDVIIQASKEDTPPGVTPTYRPSQSYHQLLVTLGYSAIDAPVAELLRVYHALNGEWLVVSLLHWEATHNDAMVRFAGATLDITEEESRALFVEFTAFVMQENMRVHYHDATTWLLQTERQPIPEAPPVHTLLDHSMRPALKTLEKTPFWLRFITESQMFFSQEATTVNGVWVWGGKPVQLSLPERSLVICGDEGWLKTLGCLSTEIACYSPLRRPERNSVYFVPDASWFDLSELIVHLRDQRVRWHWNNMTYVTKPRPWYVRWWRR